MNICTHTYAYAEKSMKDIKYACVCMHTCTWKVSLGGFCLFSNRYFMKCYAC